MKTLAHAIIAMTAENWARSKGGWNPYQWWLDNAETHEPRDGGRYKGQPNNCFSNAAVNSIACGLPYVDGYVHVHGVPLRHAWNLDEDGHPIEVTLPNMSHCHDWIGVKIPWEVAELVAGHKGWTMGEGILGTLCFLSPKELAKVLKMLKEK